MLLIQRVPTGFQQSDAIAKQRLQAWIKKKEENEEGKVESVLLFVFLISSRLSNTDSNVISFDLEAFIIVCYRTTIIDPLASNFLEFYVIFP